MLSEEDIKWLADHYSGLTVTPEGISGTVDIKATYNLEINRFLNLREGVTDEIGGIRLLGSFNINIQERIVKPFSELPALRIEGIEPHADRHINLSDGTACLGTPLDEKKYLDPEFQFQPFFEELVIPFLYGQLFYSQEGSWPWRDYGHGSIGLFESYARLGDSITAEECIQKLSKDTVWPKIKLILSKKSEIKGHTDCFCPKKDRIRNHAEAWVGLRKLRTDIIKQELTLP